MNKAAIIYFFLLYIAACKPDKPAEPIDPDYARKFVGKYKIPTQFFVSAKQDIEWDVSRASDRYIDIYSKTATVFFPGSPIIYLDTIRNVYLTDTSAFSFNYTKYTMKTKAEMTKDTIKVKMEKRWPDALLKELKLNFIRQ